MADDDLPDDFDPADDAEVDKGTGKRRVHTGVVDLRWDILSLCVDCSLKTLYVANKISCDRFFSMGSSDVNALAADNAL